MVSFEPNWHPRGLLEWQASGIDLSTPSDRAAQLFDCFLFQLMTLHEDDQLGGLLGTVALIEAADSEWPVSKLLRLKLTTGGGMAILHRPALLAEVHKIEEGLATNKKLQVDGCSVVRKWTHFEIEHTEAALLSARGYCQAACDAWMRRLVTAGSDQLAANCLFLASLYSGRSELLQQSQAMAVDACPKNTIQRAHLLSHKAFGEIEMGNLETGKLDCLSAFELRPNCTMGGHAMAHYFERSDLPRSGLAYFRGSSNAIDSGNCESRRLSWQSSGPLMACHIAWHEALFACNLGDWAQALELWDRDVWPQCQLLKPFNEMPRFQFSDAVSLLLRLEFEFALGPSNTNVLREINSRWQQLISRLLEANLNCEANSEVGPLVGNPFYDALLTVSLLAGASAFRVQQQTSQVCLACPPAKGEQDNDWTSVELNNEFAVFERNFRSHVAKQLNAWREIYCHLLGHNADGSKPIGQALDCNLTEQIDEAVQNNVNRKFLDNPISVCLKYIPIFLIVTEAFAEDNAEMIVDTLYPVIDELQELGGSGAQRDLFVQLLYYALARSCRPADKARLGALLGRRRDTRPCHGNLVNVSDDVVDCSLDDSNRLPLLADRLLAGALVRLD